MNLEQAELIARNTMLIVEDVVERMVIAGSVRRRLAVCNDVDLVVIPKFREHRDLLGAVESRENLLRSRLVEYVQQNRPKVRWSAEHRNGDRLKAGQHADFVPGEDNSIFSLQGLKAQVDFFVADELSWASTLLTRTGSKEHNIWISQRAASRGGHFKASVGLVLPGRGTVQPQSEEEFYELIGLPFVQPCDRHVAFLERIAKEVACQR